MSIKKKLLLAIALAGGGWIIIFFLLFAGAGGGSQLVPAEEELIKEYKKTAFLLGTDWETSLIIDIYEMELKGETDLINTNYLYTQLNFCQIKEEIYEEWEETDDEGVITGTGWDLIETNFYNGAEEIYEYLEVPVTEKDANVIIEAVKSKHGRITLESGGRKKRELVFAPYIFDLQTVILTYYPELEEKTDEMQTLFDSHYFMELYAEVVIDDTEAGFEAGGNIGYTGNIVFDSTLGGQVCAWAVSKVGCSYSQANRFGANSFDCSSLCYRAYKAFNIDISNGGSSTAASIAKGLVSRGCQIGFNQLAPGDLIFYSTKKNDRYMNITHVSMYIGGSTIVHAKSTKAGVVTDPASYNQSKIVLIARPSGLR